MIGLVRMSLRRPYTSAIAALLVVLLGALSVTRMIVDIFPVIDIPVVLVAWNYPGLTTEDMERRVVFISERAYSTTVNGISRIESQSIPGIGILKVYFQPGTEIGGAIAQISSVNNSILRSAPPGMQPPAVIQFNASNVPVVQMTMSSQDADRAADLRLQPEFHPGQAVHHSGPVHARAVRRQAAADECRCRSGPAGGEGLLADRRGQRAAGVECDRARRHRPDRRARIQRAAQFQPGGGRALQRPADRRVRRRPVTIGDVGRVSDSFATQTNIVHVNGKRAVYLAILKHADASTLAVVDATRAALPEVQAAAPNGLELKLDFDQSVFVRAAVENVVREAIISSILVSVLILVFLGSWRNTVIVSASIPLSVFAGIIGLFLTGNSINLMTLGGLALAIGLLVDNATVVIENIHRNLMLGKKLTVAILDGSGEVIQPLTVATLAICIVFFPVVMLFGVARYLFIPLAATVVFCMLASYALSFTVVPSFARLLLGSDNDPPCAAERLLRPVRPRVRAVPPRLLAGCWKAPCGTAASCWRCFVGLLVVTGAVATHASASTSSPAPMSA